MGASDFLRHMVASDFGESGVRSYALALLRGFALYGPPTWPGIGRLVRTWRDFVLWMRTARPARPRRSDEALG